MISKIGGAQDFGMEESVKLDSMKDIKDFLKNFKTISEAKSAIKSIINEIKDINPELANKLEKVLDVLEKAEMKGMSMQDLLDNLDDMMKKGAENSALQSISPVQETMGTFNDNVGVDASKVNQTSAIC